MFNQEQINEIIKKLSEKSKMYESFFLNDVSKNILKITNISLDDVTKALENDPILGTKFVMRHATFRAGGEQAKYGEIICESLDKCSANFGGFEKLIKDENAPQIVYKEFLNICNERSKKPNEKINERLIFDFLKRAQDHPTSNLFMWLKDSLINNGVESTYLELLKIYGINKKITSFILRDVAWLLNLEKNVKVGEWIYLQPIDTWVKQISLKLWKDLHQKVDEFIIAKRIVEKCDELGVSSLRFNQGAWYFGSKEVKKRELLEKYMNALITKY